MTVVAERVHSGPGTGRALVPVLIAIGMLDSFIGSLGSPLIPLLAEEYGRSVGETQWALTVTLLAGAVTTPVLGRLGDGSHRRTAVLAALALMAVGGALCAVPSDRFAVLVLGRAFQGLGLGLMPVAMTIATDHLPVDRVAPTVSLLSVTTAFGAGIGFPLSGLSVRYAGIRPTFALAAALTTAALIAAHITVPSSRHKPSRRIDVHGAVLLALALALFVIGAAYEAFEIIYLIPPLVLG